MGLLTHPKYRGKRISYGKRSKLVTRAYDIWATQRKRCSNPKSKDFPRYGARGIKVEYSSIDFVYWFIAEFKKRKWKWATVGRMDHDKNYSFANIKMEEMSVNAKEKEARNPFPSIGVLVYSGRTLVGEFKSLRMAEKHTGIHSAQIKKLIKSRDKTVKRGLSFKHGGKTRNSL